jgi:type VI secretion system protein ImpL
VHVILECVINGVIVAVSISDLLEQTSEQYLAQARAIHQRIQELHARFNINFPVYILFTKCDLLAAPIRTTLSL